MDREMRLGILASAILDGKPVDWERVGETTGDQSDRGIVRQLQIVSEIAALHRNLPDPDASPSAGVPASLDETRPPAEWGHLRLLEIVGRGTYGEVYRAWDPHLEREVALKLLRTGHASGDLSVSLSDPSRVVHEGRLLARVRHPHVITVHGAERRDGRVGIWMEYIRGRTLHQVVEQQGALGAREAAAVGIDLCQALAAVHRAGLLHRDVTARNVMREEGGRVVLMDFGAGHDYQNAAGEQSGSVTGTPLYMAPELFAGGSIDQRTDIYALGVLLYHLVTGAYPVTGQSLDDIGTKHHAGARTRLRDVRADLPRPFVQAVEKASAANPLDRCQTAGELEAMLEAALVGAREATNQPARVPWRLVAASAVLLAGVVAATSAPGLLKAWRDATARGSSGTAAAAGAADVLARKISAPDGLMSWSNPSDDGRYVAGTTIDGGDIAIADLTTGQYRALGMGRGDYSSGYASVSALSPDGTAIAVNWWHEERGSLRVIRADGTDNRVLIDTGADATPYQWSRDGSLILSVLTGTDGNNTIALVAAADGAVRLLSKLGADAPFAMTLSPDARYVAYDYPEAPRAQDNDIFILDTHTGRQWSLVAGPGHDGYPLWSSSGREILFFSDRSRALAAWTVPMENGRPIGEPRIMKDDVGRVWPRGLTRDGTLHYQWTAGFAEIYVGTIDGSAPPKAIAPRQALSNFYPEWSPDGRFVAYTSERRADGTRELGVYDAATGSENRVLSQQPLGAPVGWSADSRQILARGQGTGELFLVDRATGAARLVARDVALGARWIPEGIVGTRPKSIVLLDAASGRELRNYDFSDSSIITHTLGLNGLSALTLRKQGRVTVYDIASGRAREWHDSSAATLGSHIMSPHTSAVAYTALSKDTIGDVSTIKTWAGAGDPRDILRVRSPEQVRLVGWTPDDQHLLVIRWTPAGRADVPRTLWRVPVNGGSPIATALSMDALRDISLHPDGRQIAFNAGFKRSEYWVMENLLAK